MTYVYQQSTGNLYGPDGKLMCRGYSGYSQHKNKPESENLKGLGPIPRGMWVIGESYDSGNIGPMSIRLTPHGHDAHKRTYFRIHGDSKAGNASKGCIIAPRPVRGKIISGECRLLMVIE